MNRLRRALLAIPLIASVALVTGPAAPAGAAISPFSASAGVDLVHVTALGQALNPGLADVSLAPSTSAVNTAGIDGNAAIRSDARAANLDVNLVGDAIPIEDLIVEAHQTAPPDNAQATENILLPVDANPLIDADVATASAHARWINDNTCVAVGQPIAQSRSEVANAALITGQAPIGTSLVAVNNAAGGPATTSTDISFEDVAGQAGKGVRVNADTQLTGVTLFGGSANELQINVVAPPHLSVLNTGSQATSTIEYTEPVLQVNAGGSTVGELNAADANLDLQIPPGGVPAMLVRLRLGNLIETRDGQTVGGSAILLGITVLDVTGTITLAEVDVAGASAIANVPAGGVNCAPAQDPLRDVQVDTSTGVVPPGGTFDYLISVPNRGTCTLNPVSVKATVTGPAGTTLTPGVPPPTKIEGLVATWDNVGPIAPNEIKLLKLGVKVPANAPIGATWKIVVDVNATCDGAPATKTVILDGIPKVEDATTNACDLSGSDVVASHLEVVQNQTFNEYVRVINSGKQTCNAVTVVLNAPPNTSFVSCTDNCAWDANKRTVTWTIPSLAGGQSKDLAAVFKVDSNAPLGKNLPASIKVTSGRVSAEDANTGPKVSGQSVLAPLGHKLIGELPATGGSPVPALAGIGALGLALALRRRFRLVTR